MDASHEGVIERLIEQLGKLPGLGAKSAERMAHHMLKAPAEEILSLADAIRAIKERVGYCTQCYHLTDAGQPLCHICRDPRRDQSVICVVEQPRDLLALDRSGSYHGLYHVLLGRLSPLHGMGPDQLKLQTLVDRIVKNGVKEVILATNPNLEGDATAVLISQKLENLDIIVSKLARGLPSGGFLEFANREMLADAMAGRRPY